MIEPNPRSIKRLLNAYGFKVSYELLSGQTTDPDAMIRWTIIEMRWPRLADCLAKNPDWIEQFDSPSRLMTDIPEDLVPLFKSHQLKAIAEPLTPDLVRSLTCGEGGGISASAAAV